MESGIAEGDNPVRDTERTPDKYPSRTGHVEPGLNLRGPSRKAKYSLASDRELVRRLKGGKNPC